MANTISSTLEDNDMLLEIKNVSKQYPKTLALDQFSAELTSGLYGLLGPNGAGKTTLISIITTLLSPSSGTVLYNGKPVGGRDYMKIIGYLPQYPRFYKDFTAQEFLLYMAAMKGLDSKYAPTRVAELLEQVNLSEHKNKKIGAFSGGMRQRLGIAQAILNDPEILILDEPTAGLDPKERVRFRNIISKLSSDRIIILATHIVSDVECVAKEVILLKEGKLLHKASPLTLQTALTDKVYLYFYRSIKSYTVFYNQRSACEVDGEAYRNSVESAEAICSRRFSRTENSADCYNDKCGNAAGRKSFSGKENAVFGEHTHNVKTNERAYGKPSGACKER